MGKSWNKREKARKKAPFLRDNAMPKTTNYDQLPPIFSFEKMREGSGNSVAGCQQDDQASLLKKIFALRNMAWRDIRSASRKGIGTEKIKKSSIKKPIPNSVTDDHDFFLAMSYQGHKRIIGYKFQQIFYILWIDHDFSVYDHG